MFLDLPHLRFDGVYVSRNTYIRTGVVEWRVKNPVHVVCYYRYLRFFPQGDFAYRTCPETLSQVAASLEYLPKRRGRGRGGQDGTEKVLAGKYKIKVCNLPLKAISQPGPGTDCILWILAGAGNCPKGGQVAS